MQRVLPLLPDLFALIALGLLVTGAWLVWTPAAFIIGGLGAGLFAVALDRKLKAPG